MMFLIDVQKRFSFSIVCNIFVILFVLSSNGAEVGNGSINSPRNSAIDIKNNFTHSEIKSGSFENPAPATDLEVPDLIKTTHHSKTTSPVDIVSEAPPKNNKIDDSELDFNIDSISEGKSKLRANGRFNLTSGAIAAVTCLSLAVAAYIGIVLWRNVIQRNYENREILLNEDDIGDINDEDMRHFEAACIEIDA